jgi:hypothetical protein
MMLQRKHKATILPTLYFLLSGSISIQEVQGVQSTSSSSRIAEEHHGVQVLPSRSRHNSNRNNPLQNHNISSVPFPVASLVEVYEQEFYDIERKAWVGGSGPGITQRWTTSPTAAEGEDEKILPPPQLLPPTGYDYTSDWKIDVTGSSSIRDELGWEYFIHKSDRRRRRRWLRSIAQTTYKGPIHSESTKSIISMIPAIFNRTSSSLKDMGISKYVHKKVIKTIQDSFNFKGYGITLNKSILRRQNCGITFRLPLTNHFDFFETRPWLPLLTSTCALYFPIRGTFSLNASLPVAYLRFALLTLYDNLIFCLTVVWYAITKTFISDIIGIMILSNLGKILGFGKTGSKDKEVKYDQEGNIIDDEKFIFSWVEMFHKYPSLPKKRVMKYSTQISERLGVSFTWRCRKGHGVDFKFSWFHSFLPTIQHMGEKMSSTSLMKQITENNPQIASYMTVSDWLRQKVGSLGIVWGGFNDEPPLYTCNAALSLSGFYYGGESLKSLSSLPKKLFMPQSPRNPSIIVKTKENESTEMLKSM